MVKNADVREQDSEGEEAGQAAGSKASDDYVIRVFHDPAAIAAESWNDLLAAQPSSTPFMRHEYLLALSSRPAPSRRPAGCRSSSPCSTVTR